jgi:hypothetical protein
MEYDSTEDTKKHVSAVEHFMNIVLFNLMERVKDHDASKLQEPEKSMYDIFTPKLKGLTYGSDEYKACLRQMGVALEHHYANNTHHPEHYLDGIEGMSLLDLIEMFCDWQAASLRHADGNFTQSIEINALRFGMSNQLHKIFVNTAKELKWE